MQQQARLAFSDTQELCGATLHVVQQMNHTNFWSDLFDRTTTTLKNSGPVTIQQLWDDVWQDTSHRGALANIGLTEDNAAILTQAISGLNGQLCLDNDRLAVQGQAAGQSQPARVFLKATAGPPATVIDLLSTPVFDQVAATFSGGDTLYLEVAGGLPVAVTPAELVAAGAVLGRQRIAQHVRKLQDSGLATYAGEDPGTVTVLVIIGVTSIVFGAAALAVCDAHQGGQVSPPRWGCTARSSCPIANFTARAPLP